MGQILHGSATTTHAIRAAIQRSKATAKELAERHGLNPKTVAKWKKRTFVHDAPMGPKNPRSTVLSVEEEAIVVAFRKHTLLPLDDCLYALQATIPHLTRSSLHCSGGVTGTTSTPSQPGQGTESPAELAELCRRREYALAELERIKSPAYLDELNGALGLDPSLLPPS